MFISYLPSLLLIWLTMTFVSSLSSDSLDENDNMEMRQTNVTSQSTWAQLQVTNKPIISMPYGSYRINIYAQSSTTQASPTNVAGSNTYYYAPLMLLDNMSANSSFNPVTLKSEMSFRIWFWTQDVQDAVVKFIQTQYDTSAKASFIQVIPFERVILSTTASTPTPGYTMPQDWIPYQMYQNLNFKVTCFQQSTCDNLASMMKTKPADFSHFLMLFDMSSSKTETTNLDINVANLLNGNLASKLIQKLPSAETAYLTAADSKQLLMESATKIIVNSFTDNQVVDANSQEKIMNIVQNLLIAGQTVINSQSSTMWNSVFWNQDNYRPDVASSTFNSIYNKLDTTNKKSMSDSFSNSKSDTGSFGVNVGYGGASVGLETSWGTAVTNSGTMTKEELNTLMKEASSNVEWKGTAFSPKPLSLSMVNMNKLKNTQSFQSQSVKVSYTNAILSLAINSIPSSGLLTTFNPAIDFQLKLKEINETMTSQVQVINKTMSINNDKVQDLQTKVANIGKPVPGTMPTDCNSVKALGWTQSAFYTVKSSTGSKINTIYCDFSKTPGTTGYETAIGYNDVKTYIGVYFYVQRNSYYSSVRTVIPYQVAPLNIGDAMSTGVGVFTAPVKGRYYFSFSGKAFEQDTWVALRCNSVVFGNNKGYTAISGTGRLGTISITATVNLNKGDRVDTYLDAGQLADDDNHYTMFSGILLEQDLIL